jgi:Protein of unknown function C-terminus (DUF2399)
LDWNGITIGNLLHRWLPIQPWQFDRETYLHAISNRPHTAGLTSSPVTPSWDPGLGSAMRKKGRQVEEELVASELLERLSDGER